MTKTLVGAPAKKRSKHNLSAPHFTTTDLFKIQPVFAREVLKGDSFNIKMAQINRVDNLPVSSFVEINNKHDWFYVKFNQVWKPFDAFISRTPYAFNYLNTVPSKVPYFSLLELFNFFVAPFNSGGVPRYLATDYFTWGTETSPNYKIFTGSDLAAESIFRTFKRNYDEHFYDFLYIGDYHDIDPSQADDTPCVICYKLNAVGRYIYSVLYSLGYRVPRFYIDNSLFSTTQQGWIKKHLGRNNFDVLQTIETSLLPLMAYMSVMLNYYVPTKFRDYIFINSMSYLVNPNIHYSSVYDMWQTVTYQTWKGEIVKNLLSLFYGSDYFTDSLIQVYQSPQLNNSGAQNDPASSYNDFVDSSVFPDGNPPLVRAFDTGFSKYLLTALSAVSSKSQIRALTKNNLLGSMLQQFGIKPESADMIPYLLKSTMDFIEVAPEVSTADTFDESTGSGTPLGYKAGTGVGSARQKLHFKFDDYGMLICVNSITPDYSLSDGLNREMLHLTPEDYHDPAFVNLGYQAVGNLELTINPDNTDDNAQDEFILTDTFGFQNKYAEYGYPKYSMGGSFVVNSINNGLDAFHFNRKLDGEKTHLLQNNELFAQAKQIIVASDFNDNMARFESQYDRIFDVNDPNYDHIQQWTYFKVLANRPIPKNGEFIVGDDNDNVVEGKSIMDNVNV